MGDAGEQEMQVALRVFAHYLGINADTEPDLLAVAEEVFYDLPLNWEVGIGEEEHAGIPYFYNTITGESDWKHPKEEMCFRKVKQARREIEINKMKDQDRERDLELQRKNSDTSNRHNVREKEVSEVEMMEDIVEDFDDGTPPRGGAKTQADQAQLKTQEVRGRAGVASRKEGFGMSDADFLDADEPVTSRSAGNTRSGPDHSMSPPLFKEMRAGDGYDSEPSPQRAYLNLGASNRDRDRDRSTSQSLVHGNLAHTTTNQGKESTTGNSWAITGSAGIAATAVSTQGQAARRAEDREADFDARNRDRERDNSNLRGRNANNGGEYRGNNGRDSSVNGREGDGRGNIGRDARDGRDNSNNNYRGREQNREGNNVNRSRDASSRDGRDPRVDNNNTTGEKGAWNRLEEEGQRFNRDSRDNNNRDLSRGRADARDQEWRRDNRTSTAATHNNANTQSTRPLSAGTATHVASTVHSGDHVSERERELKVELQKYQEDVRKLTDDNSELADKLALGRTKHTAELSTYKEDVARLELRLSEERRERKVLEEQVTHAHAEHHSKVRDLEDVHEIKLRDAVRKARAETEDESKEKIRTLERRALEEQDALRAELALSKRKLEETLREVDTHKRKVTLSKADGKAEAQMEIDTLRATLREGEDNERKQSTELRRLREELATVQGRLVGAMQAVQLANAESDALRATAHTAVHDEQAQTGAVQAAVQRIQQLDIEVAQYKAENVLLRRERDALTQELRKAKGTAEFSGDRLTTTESETRRIKSQAQAENGRLQSRVAELEALSSVLRGQLDQAAAQQAQAVREVTRQLDSVENEAARLKDRLVDREVNEDALHTRIKTSEREVVRLQEVIFKKDRQLREESEKTEGIQAHIESIRQSCEQETVEVRKELARQKQLNNELQAQHKQDCEKLENEVSRKVPELIQQAVYKVEASLTSRHQKELADLTLMLDHRYDKLRVEMSDLQNIYSEKEARLRLNSADEKAELEKLRNNNKVNVRKIEELEEVIQELKRQLRMASNNSAYVQPHNNNSQVYASGGYSTQRKPRPFPNTPFSVHHNHNNTQNNMQNTTQNMHSGYDNLGKARTSLDFSTMLEASFDGVRHSMQGHSHTPSLAPPSYDHRFENVENYPPPPPSSHLQHHQNQHQHQYQQQHQPQYNPYGDNYHPQDYPNHSHLYPEDEPLNSMAVSFLNDQLADMKRQISRTLGEKPSKLATEGADRADTRVEPDFALQRADEAVREINSSVLGMRTTTTSTRDSHHIAGNAPRGSTPGSSHHVKFSADALFHSPSHPTAGSKHRRQAAVAGDVSSLLLQKEKEDVTAGRSTEGQRDQSGGIMGMTKDRSPQRTNEEEIETLDEPRGHHTSITSYTAAPASDQLHHSQSQQHTQSHQNNHNNSIMSDFSLNNISLVSDHPGINTSAYGHAHTPYTANYTNHPYSRAMGSTANVYSSYPSTQDNNNYANMSTTSVREFSHISDGGYHEGYWRAKYTRSTKQ